VRSGDPADVVPAVARRVGARTVHCAADFAPYGRRRDAQVEDALAEDGVRLERLGSPYAVAPGTLRKADGDPYKVYSPFQRAWADHGWSAPAPPPSGVTWAEVPPEDGDGIPAVTLPEGVRLPRDPGEEAALAAWAEFRDERLEHYSDDRNLPGKDGSSRMSPYLRWGEIHPRTILADLPVEESRKTWGKASSSVYRREIAWRDFYADVLLHRPDSVTTELQRGMAALVYDDPGERLEAWKQGRTGYPIVDAGMRQLNTHGWMHNRVRMVVASFLVKDLHLHWRLGARYFMERLADGDLASNWHGWQWVAGVGTDPAPYYRVFNPTTQSERFDPAGDYIRRHVPELADVPGDRIHEAPGVPGYPAPIVDHATERNEALARYRAVRE
jgi:deoxyribodipyrimidine photo-lyase